ARRRVRDAGAGGAPADLRLADPGAVSERIAALAVANVLMLALGAGLLPLLRLAHSRRELVVRLPLAYAVGLAATGILAAHLSLVHVGLGRVGLPLLAAAALVLGLRRLRVSGSPPTSRPAGRRRPDVATLAAYALLAVVAAFL